MCAAAVDCKGLFGSLHKDQSPASRIDEAAPECACEACALSRFGPVQHDERLLRIITVPFQYRKGRIIPAALSAAEKSGFSCFREKYVTDDELLKSAEELLAGCRKSNPNGGVIGIAGFMMSSVKAVKAEQGGSAFCVYDTEMAGKPSHADIYQRIHGVEPTVVQARRQDFLEQKEGQTFESVITFRNGLLLPFRSNEQLA